MTTCCFVSPSTSPVVRTETKRNSSPLAGVSELGVRRRVPHSRPVGVDALLVLDRVALQAQLRSAGVEADDRGRGAVGGVGSGDGADQVAGDQAQRAAGEEHGRRQGHVSHG